MRWSQQRRCCENAKFCRVLHILSNFCITIPMTSLRNVGVLGASGYAGAELLRLLARHPDLDVAWAAGDSSAGQPLVSRYPGLRAAYGELSFCSVDEGLEKGADVLFCALPHGRAAEIAPRALAAAGLVVDLSADFRLRDPGAYPAWYGAEHPFPDQLGAWPYGLPELHRDQLRGATRVAVPGCYPTAALLALAPLVAAGLVATEGIVVDAKSGLSGAGRSLTDGNLFVQANENVAPYKVGSHRHTPEIEQELALAAGAEITKDNDRRLAAVGPVGAYGFPVWYEDHTGLRLEQCLDAAVGGYHQTRVELGRNRQFQRARKGSGAKLQSSSSKLKAPSSKFFKDPRPKSKDQFTQRPH